MSNIIVFQNISTGTLQFDGLSIPGGFLAPSSSVTASDYNKEWEVQSDDQTKSFIQSGYLIVGDGNQFFSLSGSLGYVSTFLSQFPIDNDNISEGQVLYINNGTIRGTPSGSFIETGANIGVGEGVFANKIGQTLNFRSLSGSGIINVVSGANNTIIISASQTQQTTGLNTGSGQGVYKEQQGNTLVFRSILGTGSVSILSGTNDITVSGTVYINYTGSGPSTDRAIPVFSGTTGKFIQNSSATIDVSGNIDNSQGMFNGIRYYNKGPTDPVSPTPQDGDRYYNTAMRLEMVYDGFRGKWLSNESFMFLWGRMGNSARGSFFDGYDNIQFTAAKGFVPPFSGTIVAAGYSRANTLASVFELTVTGSQIAFLSSSAASGTDYSLDANFPANFVLGARNQNANGNTATDVQGWARMRWRV